MNRAPREWRNMGLTNKPEILVIEAPIVTPGCQVMNNGTIFHKSGRLSGVFHSINPDKYIKSAQPGFNRRNIPWFLGRFQTKRRRLTRFSATNSYLITTLCSRLNEKGTKVNIFVVPDFGTDLFGDASVNRQTRGDERIRRLTWWECWLGGHNWRLHGTLQTGNGSTWRTWRNGRRCCRYLPDKGISRHRCWWRRQGLLLSKALRDGVSQAWNHVIGKWRWRKVAGANCTISALAVWPTQCLILPGPFGCSSIHHLTLRAFTLKSSWYARHNEPKRNKETEDKWRGGGGGGGGRGDTKCWRQINRSKPRDQAMSDQNGRRNSRPVPTTQKRERGRKLKQTIRPYRNWRPNRPHQTM